MNHTIKTVIVLFVFGMVACQSTEKITTKKLASYGPPFDVAWHKKIIGYKAELSKSSFEETPYEYFQNPNTNINFLELGLTEKNYKEHTLLSIPIANYTIHMDSLKKWTPAIPIETYMVLDTTLIKNLLSFKKTIIQATYFTGSKGIFTSQSFTKLGSKCLSEAYFEKKLPIISIMTITDRFDSQAVFANYMIYAYKENGEFKCLFRNKCIYLSEALMSIKNFKVKY